MSMYAFIFVGEFGDDERAIGFAKENCVTAHETELCIVKCGSGIIFGGKPVSGKYPNRGLLRIIKDLEQSLQTDAPPNGKIAKVGEE